MKQTLIIGWFVAFFAIITGCSEYPHDFANEEMQIIDLKNEKVTTSTVKFTFLTSKKGTTEIFYKRISSVEKVIISDDEVLEHTILLENLVPQEDYFCRVKSQNKDGYKATVDDIIFTTKPYPQIYPEQSSLP